MKRLREDSFKNSPQEYDRLFKETEPNWEDERRWKYLLKRLICSK